MFPRRMIVQKLCDSIKRIPLMSTYEERGSTRFESTYSMPSAFFSVTHERAARVWDWGLSAPGQFPVYSCPLQGVIATTEHKFVGHVPFTTDPPFLCTTHGTNYAFSPKPHL